MSIYTDNGYKNRYDYVKSLADDLGVPHEDAFLCADMLGSNEDFDGLVTTLQEYSEKIQEDENNP